MFRYDQNVPNRDEVRPSQNEWTSSSSLLATAVTVGTTWERMSKFWKNKKSIIISALLVTALVGSTCALFIGRSPDKPEVTGENNKISIEYEVFNVCMTLPGLNFLCVMMQKEI